MGVVWKFLLSSILSLFTSEHQNRYKLWSCQNMFEASTYLLDNILIRFDTMLYRQIVGISMGTNSAPFMVDLFYFAMKAIL